MMYWKTTNHHWQNLTRILFFDRDLYRRRQRQVVAMDAMDFSNNHEAQYQQKNVLRELTKVKQDLMMYRQNKIQFSE